MKKASLLLTAIFFGSLLGNTNAATINDPQSSTITQEEWSKVKTENGIDIFVATCQLNGKSYLKVKFENTTQKNLAFSWSLTNNDQVLVQSMSQKIASGQSLELFDVTMLFEANEATLKNFNITLNLKK